MRNITTLLSLAFLACALQFAHCSIEESSSDNDYTSTETSVSESSKMDDSKSSKVEGSDSEYSKAEYSTTETVMKEATDSNSKFQQHSSICYCRHCSRVLVFFAAYTIVTVEDMKFIVPAEAMEARRKRRNTISPESSKIWPNNIVPYSFQQNVFNGTHNNQ